VEPIYRVTAACHTQDIAPKFPWRESICPTARGVNLPAVSTVRPSYIDPCLPTLGRAPPTGPDWVHQAKWDGYRLLVADL